MVMKSILVAISGTSSDNSVLDAAYAIAAPLHAHLDFAHIRLASIEAADLDRHIDFARGSGLEAALAERFPRSEKAHAEAHTHVSDFCASRNIPWMSRPAGTSGVTASWMAGPPGLGVDGIMRAARAHDLVVVGRSAGRRSWSQGLLERLAVDCGRPVLIVPPADGRPEVNRIAVWWKDHSAAARAVTAALPVLAAAGRVSVISVLEGEDHTAEGAIDVASQLGWHGIEATANVVARDHRSTIDMLWSASMAEKADLVVMGGFSRARIREIIFGGCTQCVLESGVRPVFLLH
jgi:hypothetical protein